MQLEDIIFVALEYKTGMSEASVANEPHPATVHTTKIKLASPQLLKHTTGTDLIKC